jgi:hypothetical protein
MDICSSASPKLRSGPIAASFAKAVISEPEYPRHKGVC